MPLDIDPDTARAETAQPSATGEPGGDGSPLGCERTIVQIPKPGQDDRDYFHALLPDVSQVEVKPMFGNVGAFVNGNMFCGLFGADIGVRLTDPDDRARLTQAGGGPFGPAERPMGGYLSLPNDWRDEPDQPTAREWVRLAYRQVGVLAPKARKSRKARSVQPRAR